MSDQDNGHVSTIQRPTTNDTEVWRTYWNSQGWSWRTEPEIDAVRQKYLAERRNTTPDIEKGIYPFGGIKLNRADVEWLLATHENGRGPVNWNDKAPEAGYGLDLRGANLCQSNLQALPLARLRGGLAWEEWKNANKEQRDKAMFLLQGANLKWVHLEGANLREAHLESADLRCAHLEEAKLRWAHLSAADLREAHLEGAALRGVFLKEGMNNSPRVADVRWGGANLAVVEWSQLKILGDDEEAGQEKRGLKVKSLNIRNYEYQSAVRANRQLAIALQTQGLNEISARFAYRAQKLQRIVLRLQKKFGQYLFSLFLDLLAGYGYRPGRSVLWYLAVIFGFALAYATFGHLPFFPDAFVFSLTSFHGRGFFPGLGTENSLHNPLVVTAAFEAVIGLLIEISFIATFTQRFFGR